MKEARICDTLEPVMNQHRLIVDATVIKEDQKAEPEYQLFYQMTRMTRDKGALGHDDRIDVLAMAVKYWVDAMAQDVKEAEDRVKEERLMEELKKFQENVIGFNDMNHDTALKF